MAVAAHFCFVQNYSPDWKNILLHLGYLNSFFGYPYLNPIYWTLAIEFQFYLLISFIFPIINRAYGFMAVLLLCFAGLLIHHNIGLLHVFPIFGLGILYYLFRTGKINLYIYIFTTAISAVLAFYMTDLLQLGAALLALIILMLPLKGNRFISFFSKISFSLYLTHDIIGSNLVVVLARLFPKTIVFKGLIFLSCFTITVGFAYLFYIALERPFLLLSKRVKYGN
jgi:peptidoglycan/LPS O-acetylase OafA/YrhL